MSEPKTQHVPTLTELVKVSVAGMRNTHPS